MWRVCESTHSLLSATNAENPRRAPSGDTAKLPGTKAEFGGGSSEERKNCGCGDGCRKYSRDPTAAMSATSAVPQATLALAAGCSAGLGLGATSSRDPETADCGSRDVTVAASSTTSMFSYAALNRYPRLCKVSMKRGFSAEAPNVSRNRFWPCSSHDRNRRRCGMPRVCSCSSSRPTLT